MQVAKWGVNRISFLGLGSASFALGVASLGLKVASGPLAFGRRLTSLPLPLSSSREPPEPAFLPLANSAS